MSQPPPPVDAGSVVQQLAQQFMSAMTAVVAVVDATVVDVARLVYVTILMIGLVLYFTHAERRLGKDLIKGGVVLAVLAEFVFPAISKV